MYSRIFLGLLAFGFYRLSHAANVAPNFIFILADDLGWTSLSQALDDHMPGSRSDYHETPALVRFAQSGMRFSQGYAPDALCCPSRRSIQFGQTPTRQGDQRFPQNYASAQAARFTIPRMLKAVDSRYRTAHYGKWDLRSGLFPEDLGYDESDGNTGNRHGDVSIGKDSKWEAFDLNNDPKRIDTLTDRAVSFIRRNHAAGTPFFLQLSHYATHVDMQTRAATYEKFLAKPKGRIHANAAWAGMLADLDTGIGRLLDEVDHLGLTGTTYIIFMADNGAAEFIPPVKNKLDHPSTFSTPSRNSPLRGGKWVLYEGGIRVPFIVRGPGVKAGAQCDVPVVGWDLLPTLADLAGYTAPLPVDLDGGSFRGLLASGQGKVLRKEEPLIFHRYASGYPHSAIRVGDEKLVKIWKTGALELYDLKADPGERTDLARLRPERVRVLHEQLMAYFQRMDAEVLHGYGKAKEEN
ncbi:MAG: sulfatase [Opitutaceae bacterium]